MLGFASMIAEAVPVIFNTVKQWLATNFPAIAGALSGKGGAAGTVAGAVGTVVGAVKTAAGVVDTVRHVGGGNLAVGVGVLGAGALAARALLARAAYPVGFGIGRALASPYGVGVGLGVAGYEGLRHLNIGPWKNLPSTLQMGQWLAGRGMAHLGLGGGDAAPDASAAGPAGAGAPGTTGGAGGNPILGALGLPTPAYAPGVNPVLDWTKKGMDWLNKMDVGSAEDRGARFDAMAASLERIAQSSKQTADNTGQLNQTIPSSMVGLLIAGLRADTDEQVQSILAIGGAPVGVHN